MAIEAREIHGISAPPAGTYELDTAHTAVEFVARHLLTKTRGRFTDFSGTVEVAETLEDSKVHVEIATASVQTNEQRRDEHLRSDDFFGSEECPTMTFESTAIRHTGGNGFEMDGTLTVRDETQSVTLRGEFLGWGPDPFGNTIFSATASTEIDREDWGLTWNMALESGGVMVGKKIKIEIEGEAVRQA